MANPGFTRSALILSALLLMGGHANAAPDGDIRSQMAPHKALYDIQMVARHSGAQVLNVQGQMTYEWRPTCEAWITDHHFKLNYDYTDDPPMEVVSDFSTYESFDGKTFNFSSRRQRDGELYEELRGTAAPKKAVYSMPEGLFFDLSKETIFPMAHTVGLIDAIRSGKKFFNAVVFDGSDDQGPVEINSFIGKSVNAMAFIKPTKDLDAALVNTPAWNIRMAFFPLNSPESQSDYEMNVVFHENGVISDMLVEYGDFSVTQHLAAIEKLPIEKCPAHAEKKRLFEFWRKEPASKK